MEQEEKQAQLAARLLGARPISSVCMFLIALMLHSSFVFAAENQAKTQEDQAESQAKIPDASTENPWSIKQWTVQTSLYTWHWSPDPDHNNHQHLLGVEALFANDWLAGIAIFDNSFDQSSQLLYFGKSWKLFHSKYWYVKLIGGLLHGYKEPYEDKIPFNEYGIAPVILPAIGFRYRRVLLEANIAGTSAVTITAGFTF